MAESRRSSAENRKVKRRRAMQRRKKRKKLFLIGIVLLVVVLAAWMLSSHVYKDEKAFKKFAEEQYIEEMTLVVLPGRVHTDFAFDEAENGFSTAVQADARAKGPVADFVSWKIGKIEKEVEEKSSKECESALLTRWASTDLPNGSTSIAIYSVLYETQNKEMLPEREYLSTYQLKTENGNLLKTAQTLEEGYKEAVTEQAIRRIDKEYAGKELQEDWEVNFSALEDSLNSFMLSEDTITFYEKAGTDDTYVKSEIPLKKVSGVVRPEIVERLVEPGDKMVALTYDDGPGQKSETRILESLEKYDSRATFFYLGNLIADNPDKVKKAYELGCEIGNHSWNHPDFSKMKKKKAKAQMKKTNAAIKEVTGKNPTLFRPPYGAYDEKTLKAVNLPFVLWSIDSRDWESRDKDAILEVIENAENLEGSIILMHSIHDVTADATEELLPWLSWNGYQTVTVSELTEFQTGKKPVAHEIVHCE